MAREARLIETENGLVPEGEGWFVLNAREARWWYHDNLGSAVTFEGDGEETRFPQFGINVQVLEPGEPNCMYHGENAQEDFLVLFGECLLLVEGEERPLRQWDFVHCPAWTQHVFVGAGDGPCVFLMTGARTREKDTVYPSSELARRHRVGAETETRSAVDAYAPLSALAA